jgi:hypothetical protein
MKPFTFILLILLSVACGSKRTETISDTVIDTTTIADAADASAANSDSTGVIEEDRDQYKSLANMEWSDASGNLADLPGYVGVYILTDDGHQSPTITTGTNMMNGTVDVDGIEYNINKIKVVFIPEASQTKLEIEVKATHSLSEETQDFKQEFTNAVPGKVYTFTFGDRRKLGCSEILFTFRTATLTTSMTLNGDCGG